LLIRLTKRKDDYKSDESNKDADAR
jgi:hypothetical protein